MALLRPAWMQATGGDAAISYTAAQDRAVLGALFSREGVLDKDAGHLKVVQRGAGANMSVDILAGKGAIRGDDVSDQGTYQIESTATENRATFSTGGAITAPASGSRTHRVVARIKDKMHNGVWTTYELAIEVLQDTGTGTPALPNSAITLALVTISAGQASITNANIDDTVRLRASVGTPWLTGNLLSAGIHSAYGGRDATRPLTYQKSPDGFVTLSGWFRRSDPNTAIAQDQTYWLDGANGANALLPLEARPSGVRDVIGLSSNGYLHWAFYASGAVSFRFNYNTTLLQNVTWFTLDGVVFRASAF